MSIAVKICGITSADAADAAIAAGAQYGGLVFFPRSPRLVAAEQARALAERMRGALHIVALVADADDGQLERIVAAARPDFLQLHGRETAARTAEIRGRFGVPVIRALPVAEAADLEAVPAFENVADLLMFDAKAPKDADRPGGHGAAFDWTLLAGRRFTRPWFLAGGLNPGNVARAIEASGAEMVDVSSGVESAPGVKDVARIAEFVSAARGMVRA